jgi:iron complex outermembrane receptor protein
MTRFRLFCVAAVSLIAAFGHSSPAVAQSTGTVAGTVVDETGTPLPSVNVVLPGLDRGTTTGAKGRFRLSDVPTGSHSLRARFVGYAPATDTVTVAPGTTARVALTLCPESVTLDGIRVTALRPTAQPSGNLSTNQLREAEVADPGALLRELPGIGSVRRGPTGLAPNVRGLSETEVGVYIGGMRTFPSGPARMDSPLSHVDPSAIASIDVVKGPYALTWGPSNMSAVRVTLRGEDPPRTPLTGTVRTGYDTNREAVETTGFAMGRQGRWFYSANAAWRTGADYEAGDGQTVPGDYSSADGQARLGVELSSHSTLSVKGSYQDQRSLDYPGRLLNAEFFENGIGQVTYDFSRAVGTLRGVEARLSAQHKLHGMTNEGKPSYDAGTLPDGRPRPPLRIRVDAEIQNFSGRVAADLALGPWTVTVGGDVLHTYRDARRPLEAIMPDGSRVVPPFYRTATDTLDRAWPGVTTTQEGIFAEGTRPIGDRVTLTGTARLDLAQSNATDPTQSFLDNAGVTAGALDQHDVMPSGAVTASLVLTDRWTLSLGAGTVARPPDAMERYSDRFPASKSQTSAEFQGIPPLEPERTTQGDLWLEGGGPTWSFTLNAFARRIDDYITLAPTPLDPILPLSPDTVFRYANGGATFYGTELDASLSPSDAWTARASGSWLRGTDTALDEPAFGVAPASATLGLRWTPSVSLRPVSKAYLDASTTLVAEQTRVARSRGETPTDGYTTVDLRAGLSLLGTARLELGVENLFDAAYVNHLNAKNPFSGAQLPEPGRVLTTNLTVRF